MNRITAIVQKGKDSNRVTVYVDGEKRMDCLAKAIAQHGLRVGEVLTDEQISRLQDTEELSQAKAAALRLLGYRARTVADLKRRLRLKHKFAEHTIAEVAAWLLDLGYLDDTQYATDRLDYLLRSRKMGRRGLVAKLVSEGVQQAQAQELVDESVSAEEESQWAKELAAQRAERMQNQEWATVKRRTWAYLQRRGFGSGQIRAAVEAIEPHC